MAHIAFLGLGAMGRRMAAHLLADHTLTVWNRTPARAAALVADGANLAPTPCDAVADADLVFSMVTDDDAARQVWLHPTTGALAGMRSGALALESSTATPDWIAELGAACDEAGVRLCDAPVAGSTPQAEAAQLAWLVGGEEADVDEVKPVLERMGAHVLHVGPRGHGAVFKLVVNGLFATQVAAIAELLHTAEARGLPATRALELLRPLPVTSPAAAGVATQMLGGMFTPGFPVDLVAKDLGYAGGGEVIAAARRAYEAASAAGHGGEHLSAVWKD